MSTRELDRPLEPGALGEIERALRAKLRGSGLSVGFIDRTIEDSMQRGLVAYLRALDRGEEVKNRNGFVVQAGFVRAIDDLRRESKQVDGSVLDVLIDTGGTAEPSTDEVAIEYLEAEELRSAVGQLSKEDQQVLSLHYFEELTAEASAAVLFCSERTYRRRLHRALRKLSRMLGVPVPEPGSQLAIEVGVVAWVALGGAKVALAQGPLDLFVAVAEAGHDRVRWLENRLRELVGLTGTSGSSERIAAVAGSGAGRAAGACIVAVTCALAAGGAAELAGVGSGGADRAVDRHAPRAQATTKRPSSTRPRTTTPSPRASSASATSTTTKKPTSQSTGTESKQQRTKKANDAVVTQSLESSSSGGETESTPPPAESSTPSESSTSSTPKTTPNSSVAGQSLEGATP